MTLFYSLFTKSSSPPKLSLAQSFVSFVGSQKLKKTAYPGILFSYVFWPLLDLCPQGHLTLSNFRILDTLWDALNLSGWVLITGEAHTMFGPLADACIGQKAHWALISSQSNHDVLKVALADYVNQEVIDSEAFGVPPGE